MTRSAPIALARLRRSAVVVTIRSRSGWATLTENGCQKKKRGGNQTVHCATSEFIIDRARTFFQAIASL